MVNPDVYLKKTEALRSSQYIGSFPGHISSTLPDNLSQQVVKHATERLAKYLNYDREVRSKEESVGWLRHSQITLDQQIGEGSFSEIHTIKAIKSDAKRLYKAPDIVLKMTRKDLTSNPRVLAKCAANLVKEGIILATLDHENIIRVHAWTPTGLRGFHIGRSDSFFLILDRLRITLGGKLGQWEQHAKRLKFAIRNRAAKKAEFLKQRLDVLIVLSGALKYLHRNRVIHRDLKPDNIGFDDKGVLKIYDFDTARIMPHSADPDERFAFTRNAGSRRYMSPECARGDKYNLKSDVYSFGLLCHEVLTLARPFQDIASDQHDEMVFTHIARPELPDSWPKGLCKMLELCWAEDIDDRPDMTSARRKLKRAVPQMLAAKKMKHALVATKSLSRRDLCNKQEDEGSMPGSPTCCSFEDSETCSSGAVE